MKKQEFVSRENLTPIKFATNQVERLINRMLKGSISQEQARSEGDWKRLAARIYDMGQLLYVTEAKDVIEDGVLVKRYHLIGRWVKE